MFQFTDFPLDRIFILLPVIRVCLIGFPHSDSRGSRPFSSSPRLFAALHVLRRLSVPRHPPLALCSFTYRIFVLFFLTYILLVSLMITYLGYFNNSCYSLILVSCFANFYTLIILCNFQCTTSVI